MDLHTPITKGCASFHKHDGGGAAGAQVERARELLRLAGSMARKTTGMERVRCLLEAVVCCWDGKCKGGTDMTGDVLLWSSAQRFIVAASSTAEDLKDTLDRCEGHMQQANFFHAYMADPFGITAPAGHIGGGDVASHDELRMLIDEYF